VAYNGKGFGYQSFLLRDAQADHLQRRYEVSEVSLPLNGHHSAQFLSELLRLELSVVTSSIRSSLVKLVQLLSDVLFLRNDAGDHLELLLEFVCLLFKLHAALLELCDVLPLP
jgi:hypothetical protein